MRFFVGVDGVQHAKHFDSSFISVKRLMQRKSAFQVGDWIMNSGAFSTIAKFGCYPEPVSAYAAEIVRWKNNGNLLAAVAQDYMCEPAILTKTQLSVTAHQTLTIQRYDNLLQCNTGCYIMPVLQGFTPDEYLQHVDAYGNRLASTSWIAVGSICKRKSPKQIFDVLVAIKSKTPTLQLHGFGLTTRALMLPEIRSLLTTADSMGRCSAARWAGTGGVHDWRTAGRFKRMVDAG